MRDLQNIGQDKTQNPEEAFRKQQGTYNDAAQSLPQRETIDFMPKANDPTPFTVRR